jgi:hypothetical protein
MGPTWAIAWRERMRAVRMSVIFFIGFIFPNIKTLGGNMQQSKVLRP